MHACDIILATHLVNSYTDLCRIYKMLPHCFPIIEQKKVLSACWKAPFVFYLADTLSGVVQFNLLGLDEHAQFLQASMVIAVRMRL